MTVPELRDILEPYGISPLKSRSQHFLLDDSVVERMLASAAVQKGDAVCEIGPGPGILTEALLNAGARVVAAELDPRLCTLLRDRYGSNPAFSLLEGDVLRRTNAELSGGAEHWNVVANLPYAITSAVITKLLLEKPYPDAVVIMIQKEVADRLLATAEKGEMGSLPVLAQTYARIERVCNVPKGAFLPPPKVESAVVKLTRRSQAELDAFFADTTPEQVFALTKAAFAAPRKQVKNTLRAVVPDESVLEAALEKAAIAPSTRPERLRPEDWANLARALRKNRG